MIRRARFLRPKATTINDNDDEIESRPRARLVDRMAAPERALVLVPVLTRRATAGSRDGLSIHSPEDRLTEARGLAEAIDLDIRDARIVTISEPRPGTLFGSGKVEELKAAIADMKAGLVIVDQAISPVQQRNLEQAWNAKVLDRTGLILEIFGRRAQTREGRLQVELAHLSYQKGRLVRAWTHLERQRGGAGFLGGPGEAQIELDRRMLDARIQAIKKELEQVVRTRELHRAGRRKVPYPIVAIAGYTNAGKSTLFNRITGAGVLAMDQVFATLDPTMREVKLDGGRRIILSDTVGFISDLPPSLVAAFRATLEEVVEADLILHVRDISHAETEAQARDVEAVLASLGIDTVPAHAHILEVWNKVDLLSPERRVEIEAEARFRERKPVLVSAQSGQGIDQLVTAIRDRLGAGDEEMVLTIPASEGRLMSWLHRHVGVIERTQLENGDVRFHVRVGADHKGRLMARLAESGLAAGVLRV